MINNAILEQLEAARSEYKSLELQIIEFERKRDIAKAKVEAFELSAKYIADMRQGSEIQKKTTRNRMPSSDWVKIFSELYSRYKSGFGYDEIIGVASSIGISLKRPSLRSKMMNLTQEGYVTRISNGNFQVTDTGAKYFNLVTTQKPASTMPGVPISIPPAPTMAPPPTGMVGTPTIIPSSRQKEQAPDTQIPRAQQFTGEAVTSPNDDDIPF